MCVYARATKERGGVWALPGEALSESASWLLLGTLATSRCTCWHRLALGVGGTNVALGSSGSLSTAWPALSSVQLVCICSEL